MPEGGTTTESGLFEKILACTTKISLAISVFPNRVETRWPSRLRLKWEQTLKWQRSQAPTLWSQSSLPSSMITIRYNMLKISLIYRQHLRSERKILFESLAQLFPLQNHNLSFVRSYLVEIHMILCTDRHWNIFWFIVVLIPTPRMRPMVRRCYIGLAREEIQLLLNCWYKTRLK